MTIPDLLRIWEKGSSERLAQSVPVERVVDLWYAHGAVLPKVDSTARRSPMAGPSMETQGWQHVEKNVAPALLHALAGVLSAERCHPVTEALAFRALDVLAEFEREGHGFIGIRPDRKGENVDADGHPNSNHEARTLYEERVEKGVIQPTWRDKIRGKIAKELGIEPPRKPVKKSPTIDEGHPVRLEGAQTATEKRKGWNGGK